MCVGGGGGGRGAVTLQGRHFRARICVFFVSIIFLFFFIFVYFVPGGNTPCSATEK